MNQELFKQYQRELNHCRENELKTSPKLSPKVLLNNEDFDVSINDIPIQIKMPVLPVRPVPVQKQSKTDKTSKELW